MHAALASGGDRPAGDGECEGARRQLRETAWIVLNHAIFRGILTLDMLEELDQDEERARVTH